ncbi:MAG: serine hydrolase [Clostridia bacterium]|nr:serine hydrolase [Clostridia bacterium]
MANIQLIRSETLPDQEWQKRAVFPDWKGYTDDTLAMNSMLSFLGFHGQGVLWLRVSDTVESFILYVNGVRADPVSGGGIFRVDFAAAALDGVNTIQLSNIEPLGLKEAVEVFVGYPEVLPGTGMEGIRPEPLRLISDLIESDIRHGFPGAQLAVLRNGRLVVERSFGHISSYRKDGTRQLGPAVTADTMYDLASVTKMFAANYALQKLVTDGLLDTGSTLVSILGEAFAGETLDFTYAGQEHSPDHDRQIRWKRALTVRDILCHRAGFPPSPHFNNPDFDMAEQAVGKPGSNRCYAANRREMPGAVFRLPLLYEPGTKTIYSDVDYILLCLVIETVTGKRLDEYLDSVFYGPLGLRHITFLPLERGFQPEDCAATELNGNTRDGNVFFKGIRTETIQGEVQDERAWYCMEGVSGHAGLFASATDLARLASIMLTGGYGRHRFFSRNVMDLFTSPKSPVEGHWGLGWWREGDDQRVWYFGTQAAPGTVGHEGWTGTLAMVDPSRHLVIVYLTNAIHSPVVSSSQPNGFSGRFFTASTLGFVPQILSIGMDSEGNVRAQLLDLLADMAAESLKRIPGEAGSVHPSVENVRSKLDVLRAWASEAGDEKRLTLADRIEKMLP